MSRRSRIDTVERVAELRERQARAAVAATQVSLLAAQASARARMIELSTLREIGPTDANGLRVARTTAGHRAGAVLEADRTVDLATQEKTDAIAAWSAAAQRQKALQELAARHRAAELARREAMEQRLVDDLGARDSARPVRPNPTQDAPRGDETP